MILFGQEIELRPPSVKDAIEMAESQNDAGVLVDLLIRYAYVPGTNERVFEEGDREIINNWPVGSWIKEFMDKMNKLSNLDLEEARKN